MTYLARILELPVPYHGHVGRFGCLFHNPPQSFHGIENGHHFLKANDNYIVLVLVLSVVGDEVSIPILLLVPKNKKSEKGEVFMKGS